METPIRPTIALTTGDPTGIGPEIVAKVLASGAVADAARLVVVGDRRVLARGMAEAGVSFDLAPVDDPAEETGAAVPLVDLRNCDPADFSLGEASAEAGRIAGDTLAKCIDMARAGRADAITFAPLNKRALYDGGWRFPDEHKMFAHLLGHTGYFSEMNVLGDWWMFRVTSHIALREVADAVTDRAIRDAIRLAVTTMRQAGIAAPRLAVTALNPHNGENGLFGREEIEVIRPAVAAMAAEGWGCEGPFPSDTVYLKVFAGQYDGALSMYHDQGQIATKLKGFGKGVTVTAGLDVVFTTPAHGTAFDIVGRGVADPSALETAIRLAARLAVPA